MRLHAVHVATEHLAQPCELICLPRRAFRRQREASEQEAGARRATRRSDSRDAIVGRLQNVTIRILRSCCVDAIFDCIEAISQRM
jgi:hypothetical protein